MTRADQMALARWLMQRGEELKLDADNLPEGRANFGLRQAALGKAQGAFALVQDVLSDTFPLVTVRRK